MFLETLLGANWRAHIWKFICVVATYVVVDPTLTSGLPGEKYINTLAGIVLFLSGQRGFRGAPVLPVEDEKKNEELGAPKEKKIKKLE